jgi:hypothetical protein
MCGLEKEGPKGKKQLAKKRYSLTPSTIFFTCEVPYPKNDFHQK